MLFRLATLAAIAACRRAQICSCRGPGAERGNDAPSKISSYGWLTQIANQRLARPASDEFAKTKAAPGNRGGFLSSTRKGSNTGLYIAMWFTTSLQSLSWLSEPCTRTRMAYIVPGVRFVAVTLRGSVK